uniref:protein-disulfide reductase DsbD domain-containing protein n=1 Tax=Yoonia sp. TaxID=2212373 RepID=UPI004047BF51
MKHTLLLAATLTALGGDLRAQMSEFETTLTVLTGWETNRDSHMAGLRIDVPKGWKTYWRAPGDAGIPPQIDWAGSTNIASVAFNWPVPQVFELAGMRSIGYYDSVTIPIEVFRASAGEMRLSGVIEIGVCQDICVPVTLDFDAVLPRGGEPDADIAAALRNRPLTAQEAGAGDMTCTVKPIDGGMQITASTTLAPQVPPPAIKQTGRG